VRPGTVAVAVRQRANAETPPGVDRAAFWGASKLGVLRFGVLKFDVLAFVRD
jgi:hypothetical protein